MVDRMAVKPALVKEQLFRMNNCKTLQLQI